MGAALKLQRVVPPERVPCNDHDRQKLPLGGPTPIELIRLQTKSERQNAKPLTRDEWQTEVARTTPGWGRRIQ